MDLISELRFACLCSLGTGNNGCSIIFTGLQGLVDNSGALCKERIVRTKLIYADLDTAFGEVNK
jgi:hypothetical protein